MGMGLGFRCPYRKHRPAFKCLHLELRPRVRCRCSKIPFLAACDASMFVLSALYQLFRGLLVPRLVLVTENLALRQQLLVLHRSSNRPWLRHRDRLFWIALSQLWRDWRSILVIVKPETVIKWHRQGFRCYWHWKSRHGRVGRPKIDKEIRDLIRRMSRENPIWGVPRIQAELHLLGYEIAESTVAKYRLQSRQPPSQTWKSFLRNHAAERLIGSIRRECLDHLIVLGEGQLRSILREYFGYYNEVRPHQSLERNAPIPREIEPLARGKIISLPQVGGLHHRYLRVA